MIGINDILSSLQNAVRALSNIYSAINTRTSQYTSAAIPAATTQLIVSSPGRLIGVSVINKGTSAGTIYNAMSVATIGSTNALYGVDNGVTPGYYPVDLIFDKGLVITTGNGQIVTLVYNLGIFTPTAVR